MVTQPRYGVLLLGGARTHQELYAPLFAADPRCRLVGLADEPPDATGTSAEARTRDARFAAACGVPHLPDLDAALARPDIDLVSVCVPPDRRARVAVRCARAGKHLYLDKPAAPSGAEARAIADAARAAGVHSQMFSFVTQPWARRARQVLDEGRPGPLLALHADTFFAKGPSGTARPALRSGPPPSRRLDHPTAKHELDNVGIYPVTLVRWLTGRRLTAVHALTGNYFFREHWEQEVEDFGVLAGALDNGVAVTIAAGRTGWSSHPAGGVNRVVLVGRERTLVADALRPRLEVTDDGPPWGPPRPHPEDPMGFWPSTLEEVGARPKRGWLPLALPANDPACFLDALDAGRDGEVSAAEAALACEVLDAAYLSASLGRPVPVATS